MIINFQSKKMPKEKAPCQCLSIIIIMLDSVIKAKKKCYSQTLLEECKYEQEKKKLENFIDDLEKSSSDESDNDSNDETEFDNDESNE